MISFINKGTSIVLLLGLLLTGCNNDSEPRPDPGPNPIASVNIDTKEVVFNEIGQSQEFSAKAYDEDGREINTLFTWSSSNAGVVAIGANGVAEAIGPGNASIYVTAEAIVDSARVVVELPENPSIWWSSATDGDWSDATNWSTGTVPSPTDTIAIPLEGDYTVTLTTDVTVAYLFLGAPDGTQRLATGSNTLTMERGKLSGGAELQIGGMVNITDEVYWVDGEITGSGTIEVQRDAEIHAGGGESKLILRAKLLNSGTFAIVSDVTIDISGGTLENQSSARIDFQGDGAVLNVFAGGTLNNLGNIFKSEGPGDAGISASSSSNSFISSGFVGVESGTLKISGGDLAGVIDVDAGAELRQISNTLIRPSLLSKGDGLIEITGTVTLGEVVGDLIRLNNVVFDSWNTTGGISGPGDLRIKNSLLWRKGGITGAGKVFIDGATVRLESTGSKVLSERIFEVDGLLETESLINLTLVDGAQIIIDISSEWIHTGSGTIKKSSGATPGIMVLGTFRKRGGGAFVVEADFTCAGQMYLEESVLTVKGSFNLQDTGKLIGGGTDPNPDKNLRLIVIEAPSAILAGTIEVDADGEPATMNILGSVTIEPTFKVLIDFVNTGPIPAERLTFLTGGVALAGTLDVTVATTPDAGSYRVVSTIDGTGSFDSIIGAQIGDFDTIQEDVLGVMLIRN
jgi:Big-like domain-containing protein